MEDSRQELEKILYAFEYVKDGFETGTRNPTVSEIEELTCEWRKALRAADSAPSIGEDSSERTWLRREVDKLRALTLRYASIPEPGPEEALPHKISGYHLPMDSVFPFSTVLTADECAKVVRFLLKKNPLTPSGSSFAVVPHLDERGLQTLWTSESSRKRILLSDLPVRVRSVFKYCANKYYVKE